MFKALDIWLPAYLRHPKPQPVKGMTHILLAFCDHFEPFNLASYEEGVSRVEEWQARFPRFQEFRDSGGAPPKHTFFYPIEQYKPEIVERIACICRETQCEVEVHLHHDKDSAEGTRAALERGKEDFLRHGLLSHDASGATRFGFIHGNWALDDSHPQGKQCGVRHELRILKEAGCYADFTLPSAPGRTQTRIVNSLYYATSTDRSKSHDTGTPARVGNKPSGDLLLVQGPLGLNWRWRKLGLFPRIENGDLTGNNPPTLNRLKLWLDLQIQVQDRPEWVFVKLHTHGAPPANRRMLLGEPMRQFHTALARFVSEQPDRFAFHYVTAREMVNILHAAEDGLTGSPAAYRDYQLRSNLVRS